MGVKRGSLATVWERSMGEAESERDGDRARLRQGRGLGLRGRPSGEGNVKQRHGLVACGCWASSLSPSYSLAEKN